MTNKEFEEQITAALLSGKGQLIPVSELGMSSEGYCIDNEYLNDELYKSYIAMCHSNDADDVSQAFERVTKDYLNGGFTVFGQRGMFKWFTLAAKYPTNVHRMNDEKNEHNVYCSEVQKGGGYSLGLRLANAINSCDLFTCQLQSCIVVDISIFLNNDASIEDTMMMTSFLENFFNQKERNLLYKDNGKQKVKKAEIKGKDVIIPFAYITENTLNYFPKIAKQLFIDQCEANTVTAVGLIRFVPSIDGKQGTITQNDFFPLISPNPLLEVARLF